MLVCRLSGRQAVYGRNTEARLCHHFCRRKAISITYFECMFVALGFQHAKRTNLTILSSGFVSLYNIFPHYLINGTVFETKQKSY